VPLESWRAIIAKAVEQAQSGHTKAREWLRLHLLPKSGDTLNLARLDAADRLQFDLSEIHVSDMYRQARLARSTAEVIANFMAAEEAGIKTKSMAELLKIGLFGPPNGADSNGEASPQDVPH
jgi:hypothetical protein